MWWDACGALGSLSGAWASCTLPLRACFPSAFRPLASPNFGHIKSAQTLHQIAARPPEARYRLLNTPCASLGNLSSVHSDLTILFESMTTEASPLVLELPVELEYDSDGAEVTYIVVQLPCSAETELTSLWLQPTGALWGSTVDLVASGALAGPQSSSSNPNSALPSTLRGSCAYHCA